MIKKLSALILCFILLGINPIYAKELKILSSGDSSKFYPIVENYEQETGTKIIFNIRNTEDVLNDGKIGDNDVFLGEASHLFRAANAGLLQPLNSDYITEHVNPKYIDPNGLWVGHTFRAKAIYYNRDRVTPSEIISFENLSEKKWHKRVCPFNAEFTPNLEFIAYMIGKYGKEYTATWYNNLKNNFAFPYDPKVNTIEAVGKGLCDISYGINYHYGLMFGTPIGNEYYEYVGIYFPDHGVTAHMKSAGILRDSSNPDEARKFIEYMLTYLAQTWYSSVTHTYSVRDDVPISRIMKNNSGNIDTVPNIEYFTYFKYMEDARQLISN